MDALLPLLSQLHEIQDPEEETFLLYSHPIPSQNLGFIDPRAHSLSVTVSNREYTIHQSPGVLSSTRAGGTTGAVLWKVTPIFAEWISSDELFKTGVLNGDSSVVELGCGISPLNALALSGRVARYLLTDQAYVGKLVERNLTENLPSLTKRGSKAKVARADIRFQVLDWETDQVTPALVGGVDVVTACDCVFNYALVKPFVQTCADVCRLRRSDPTGRPCLAIIAQQLRNDDVFRSWLEEFCRHFHVWRVPDESLPEALRPGTGFVVHVGVLKEYQL